MALRPRYNPQSAGRASPAPYLPANFGQSQGLQQLGAALAEIGVQLQARQDKEDALWAQEKFNEFQAEWSSSFATRSNQALAAPTEFSRFDEEERLRYREATTEFLRRIDSERRLPRDVRRALQGQLSTYGLRAVAAAQEVEQNRNALATENLLQAQIDLATNEIISSPNSLEFKEQRIKELIAANQEALGAKAVPFTRNAMVKLRMASIEGRMKQDPRAVLAELHDGKYDALIPGESKAKAIDAAYREIDFRAKEAERAETRAERQRKDAQERRYADLLVATARGQVTQDFLVQELERGNIDPAQFRTLRGDYNNSTEPNYASELKHRVDIYSGTGSLLDVLQDETLTDQQKIGLANLVEERNRNGGALTTYEVKTNRRRVDEVLGGVRGPLAVLDTATSERVANALQYYEDLVIQGANPREAADRTIERYRQTPETLASLPRPTGWEGPTTGNKATLTKRVAEAQARVLAQESRGELTPMQVAQALRDLRRYQEIIDRMDK